MSGRFVCGYNRARHRGWREASPMGNLNFRLFSLFGIPVYASIWYFLITVLMGLDAAHPVLWIGAVTVSILVHEFGHGLVARAYRLSPAILLHGWGGLCSHSPARRDLHDVLILVSGPGAGFLLGFVALGVSAALGVLAPQVASNPSVGTLLTYLMYVNFFWSALNLIPMWPLDGGRLLRIGLVKLMGGARGEQVTHGLGIGLALFLAVAAYKYMGTFSVLMCLMIAFNNYQHLSSGESSGPIRRAAPKANPQAKDQLGQAEEALRQERWREAARLGHLARAGGLSDREMARVWAVLGLATSELGEPEDAVSYLRQAPPSLEVVEAELRCLLALGRLEEAKSLVGSPRGQKLSSSSREQVAQRLQVGARAS